jgi:TP901 family phage tail tape measure protein
MSDTARKISVIVDADSVPFQEEMEKAGDSEKAFIDVVLQAAKDAVAANDATVKSNASVADSYGRTASVVTGSVQDVVDRIMGQMSAQRELAAGAVETSTTVVDAVGRQVDAYAVAKDQMALFADEQAELAGQMQMFAYKEEEAYSGVADAATAAADKQIEAAAKTAEAASASADKQAEAYAAAGDASAASADKQAASATKSADSNAKSFGASGTGLVTFGKRVLETAGVVAAGSLYMSEKFEESSLRLQTQAGANNAELVKLRAGMLDMAGALGQTPAHLDEGLYHIVSSMEKILPAAHRTSEELDIMKIAAEGAAIGGTSMEETSYTLASAMNSLHEHAGDAAHTMAELNAIVGSGDMTMGDLLAALKSGLIPTAAQFEVSLQSVGAALAVMGDMGMRGAMAGTRLRMSIALIGAPAAKASEELAALGMSGGEVKARTEAMTEALDKAGLSTTTMAADLKKPDGIAAALSDLKQHLTESGVSAEDQAAIMVRAFGGGRMASTIDLLTQNVGRVGIKYTQIGHEVDHFGTDWTKTQETLKFEVDQTGASIEALGIHIGEDLTPEAEDGLKGLKEMATWLDHNRVAAEALAVVVAGGLSVAVAAFTVNKLNKMVEGLKAAGTAMAGGSRWLLGSSGGSATASSSAGGASGLTSKEGMLSGSRGTVLPGSMTNPVVTAQESGQYAGLGGEAAAEGAVSGSEGDVKAAAAEGKSTESALPVVAATSAEDAAGGAGVLATVKTGLSSVLGNAMKGGLVGLGGVLASELAKSMIGGKTGKAVGAIGSDTAIGAAIGTAIEPGIGTAVGAALGGVAGLVKHLEGGTQAQQIAESTGKGTEPSVREHLQSGVEDANKVAEKAIYSIEHQHQEFSETAAHWLHEHTFGIVANPAREKLAPYQEGEKREAEERKEAQLYAVGKQFGAEHIQEQLNAVQDMSGVAQITSVITDTEKRLQGLPVAAQQGAFESIMAIVKEYQKDGKLPPTSVEELVHSIEGKFPALKQAFSGAGDESVNALNQALKGQNVLGSIESLVDQWRNVFPQLPKIVGLNLTNAEQTFSTVMSKLDQLAHTGPESQRAAASEAYKKMRDEEIGYFSTMRTGVEGEIHKLEAGLHKNAPGVVEPIETAFHRMVEVIKGEMSAGVKETTKGTEQINNVLRKELHALGLGEPSKQNKAFGAMPGGGGNPLQPTNTGGSSGFTGLAQGGLVQLGRPGEGGKDTIPLNAGGIPIMAGAGEQVAVFTRHQQAVANQHLAGIGGLPGLFNSVKTPNYMASGGFVAEPGTNFTVGYEPRIVADLRKLAAELKETVYGISGYRSPAHSVAVGGFSNDPHTEGKAADIGAGAPTLASMLAVPEADLRKVGLYRPFFPPDQAEANHVQLIGVPYGGGSGTPTGAGSAGAGATGTGAVAQMVAQIATPKVGGTGVIAQIAQAALTKAANAANEALNAAGGSTGGSGSIGSGLSGAWTQVMAQIAKAKHWSLPDWKSVVQLESGGNPTARNPSGAYGLGQALGATQREYPKMVSPNPSTQIEGMAEYIAGRYGNPTAALAHEHAYHWYEEGGFVNADQGLLADASAIHATKLSKGTEPKAAKGKTIKGKAQKEKTVSKGKGAPSGITSLIHKLGGVPDTENVNALQPFPPLLAKLANERSLLSKIQGMPDRYFILPEDMSALQPTMAKGESIHPGMTVTEAQRQQVVAMQAAKGESEPLSEQAELLTWLTELPTHHLLTAGDAALIPAMPGSVSGGPKAGEPIGNAIENVMMQEEETNISMLHVEDKTQHYWQELRDTFKARQAQVLAHAKAEYKRLTNIKGQIKRLTTGSLETRLKAAEEKDHVDQLKADAAESEAAITEDIAGEKTLPAKQQNTKLINEWEKDKRHVADYARTLSKPLSGTPAAKVALQKNTLTNEMPPLEESLKTLAGSSTSVGTGGDYKTLGTDVKYLNEGITKLGAEMQTEQEATIPTLALELSQLRSEDADAGVKPVPKVVTGESEQASVLNAALKEEIQQMTERAAIQSASLSTFKNFIPQIPHYEKGGPVLDDGLIYAHKGEHVVPQGGTLVSSSSPAPVFNHKTDVHGDAAGLIKLIDSRVTHPANVRQISQMQMRRTDLIRGRGR